MGKIFLFSLLGFVLGGTLGVIIPIGMAYAAAASDGFKPGGNGSAATAFALMLPFTTIVGAFVGAIAGVHRARTGKWGMSGGESAGSLIHPANFCESLAPEKLALFDSQISSQSEAAQQTSRLQYLQTYINDYRKSLSATLLQFGLLATLSLVLFPISLTICAGFTIRVGTLVFRMRSRLSQAIDYWEGKFAKEELQLPTTLSAFPKVQSNIE